MLEFEISRLLFSAMVVIFSFPILLFVFAKLPGLRRKNALQFFVTSLFVVLVWLIYFTLVGHQYGSAEDILISLMLIMGGLLLYLEIWALLSRGYTLQLLLTLYEADVPLQPEELAANYRQGDGLEWIFHHRLTGLRAAKLITYENGFVGITKPLGMLVAGVYRFLVRFLGLKVTG